MSEKKILYEDGTAYEKNGGCLKQIIRNKIHWMA